MQSQLRTLTNQQDALDASLAPLKRNVMKLLNLARPTAGKQRSKNHYKSSTDNNDDDELPEISDLRKELESWVDASGGGVGARERELLEDTRRADRELEGLEAEVARVRRLMGNELILPEKVHVVSSRTGRGVEDLKAGIAGIILEEGRFPTLNEQLPLSYFEVL